WNRLPGPRSAPGLRAAPHPGRLVRRLPPRHRRRPHYPAALHRAGDSAGESGDQPVHPGRSARHRALRGDAAHRLARGAGPGRAPPPPRRRPRLGSLPHGQGAAPHRAAAAPRARPGPPLRRAHRASRAARAAEVAAEARPMTRKVRLTQPAIKVERRADGTVRLRSSQPLGSYPAKLTERLDYWAGRAPERVFLAQRSPDGGWRRITYAQIRTRARRVAAALLGRGLSAERPVAVLSGNDIEHAELAAMYAGVAYAPVSPAYSLVSSDFAQLRRAMELVTPGLIFVADRKQFRKAIDAVAGRTEVIDALPERDAEADVDAAHARVGPDTVAKFLFT